MNTCDQMREWMSDHIDGALDPSRSDRLLAHLDQCQECQKALKQLRLAVDIIHAVPEVEPPNDLLQRIHERLAHTEGKRATPRNVFALPQMQIAIAATVLLAVGLFGLSELRTPKTLPSVPDTAADFLQTPSQSAPSLEPPMADLHESAFTDSTSSVSPAVCKDEVRRSARQELSAEGAVRIKGIPSPVLSDLQRPAAKSGDAPKPLPTSPARALGMNRPPSSSAQSDGAIWKEAPMAAEPARPPPTPAAPTPTSMPMRGRVEAEAMGARVADKDDRPQQSADSARQPAPKSGAARSIDAHDSSVTPSEPMLKAMRRATGPGSAASTRPPSSAPEMIWVRKASREAVQATVDRFAETATKQAAFRKSEEKAQAAATPAPQPAESLLSAPRDPKDITVTIPRARLDDFLAQLRKIGEIFLESPVGDKEGNAAASPDHSAIPSLTAKKEGHPGESTDRPPGYRITLTIHLIE